MAVKKTGHYIKRSTFTPKAVYLDVSEAIEIFKIDFIDNIEYLLEYTKLPKASFYREMSRYGVPSFKKKMDEIKEGKRIGFDIYYVAAVSKVFQLPVKLILNYNIRIKRIDLEKYGIYQNCYKVTRKSRWDGVKHGGELTEPHPKSIHKKKEKMLERIIENSNFPEKTLNFWQEWNKTTVTK